MDKLTTIETKTCSRCGGTGRHSYCTAYGDVCFKCSGAGRVYTARGLAAANHLRALRSLPFAELRPGMQVQFAGVNGWQTVVSLAVELPYECSGKIYDERREIIETERSAMHGLPGEVYRVRQNKEQMAATLAAALEFQATLTKSGKPAKRS